MDIGQSRTSRNVPRPAVRNLIVAMERLPGYQRREICRLGRRAMAARAPRLRRLAREAAAESRRLAAEAAQ
jgi:hypothetical protein